MGHTGVGWSGLYRGVMGHAGVGWGGSCRGGVGWIMQGWGGSCRDGMGSHLSDCKIMNFCAINFKHFMNDSNSRNNNSRDSKIHEWI